MFDSIMYKTRLLILPPYKQSSDVLSDSRLDILKLP